MPEFTADSLYADLRRQGQITLGGHLRHLVPGLRYRAKRDGIRLTTHTRQGRRRGFIPTATSTSVTLLDADGLVYAPDATPR